MNFCLFCRLTNTKSLKRSRRVRKNSSSSSTSDSRTKKRSKTAKKGNKDKDSDAKSLVSNNDSDIDLPVDTESLPAARDDVVSPEVSTYSQSSNCELAVKSLVWIPC